MIAEIYGQCGFDYVFIEGEHFPYGPESVLQMVRGCECGGIEPILRIVDHDPGKILQFLDMGVTGLLLPHCDTPQQAKAIMDAGKSFGQPWVFQYLTVHRLRRHAHG